MKKETCPYKKECTGDCPEDYTKCDIAIGIINAEIIAKKLGYKRK